MNTEKQEVDLEQIIDLIVRTVRKRWRFIVFPSILGLLLTNLVASTIKKLEPCTYESYAIYKTGINMGEALESTALTQEIAYSQPTLIYIAKSINSKMKQSDLNRIKKSIVFDNQDRIVRILVKHDSPIEAYRIASSMISIIYERHSVLYNESRTKLNTLVKSVRDNIKPSTISTGLKGFIIEPTKVEVYPTINPNPINENKNNLSAFILCILLTITFILSLYLESKDKVEDK